MIKRVFDILLAFFSILAFGFPMILIALAVKLTSKGPAVYWSDRMGLNNCIFKMPKFRTMTIETPALATRLMQNPEFYLTPIGFSLRKYSLDELPQLYSVLKGDISFVGPRPVLIDEQDLIKLRTAKGIYEILPGITGWAQINGRDDLTIPQKVAFEEDYLKNKSIFFDIKILLITLIKVIKSENVSH